MLLVHQMLGYYAGGISLAGYVVLAFSVFDKDPLRRYKPERATWFIWAFVTGMIALTLISEHAWVPAIIPLSYCLGSISLAILSVKYGEGGWSRDDRRCIAISLIGVILWAVTRNPMWGLVLNIIADGAGGYPSLKRVWVHPDKEDRVGWAIFLLGASVNLFAVEKWDVVHAGYPIFIICFIGTMVWLTFRKPAPEVH